MDVSEVSLKSNNHFKMADCKSKKKHIKPQKEAGSSMTWTAWAQKYGSKVLNAYGVDEGNKHPEGYFEKKINRAELPTYGVCPAVNQLFLVVCNSCGKSVTPQGLMRHYEHRHSNKQTSCGTLSTIPSSHLCSSVQSASTPRDLPSVATSDRRSSLDSCDDASYTVLSPQHRLQEETTTEISSLPSDDSVCARTNYLLSIERWSGKRKRTASPPGHSAKHIKPSSKQRWVDGLGQSASTDADSPIVTASTSLSSVSRTSKPDLKSGSVVSKNKLDVSKSVAKSGTLTVDTTSTSALRTELASNQSSRSRTESDSLSSPVIVKTKVDLSTHKVSPGTPQSLLSKSVTPSESHTKIGSVQPVVHSPVLPVKSLQTVAEKSSNLSQRSSRSKDKSQRDPSSLPCKVLFVKDLNGVLKTCVHCDDCGMSHSKMIIVQFCKSPCLKPCLSCSLKYRLFDADQHCGVWLEDESRRCTHSLTCKIHSLSLRRAVNGRSRPFDELLADHRVAKEKQKRPRVTESTPAVTEKQKQPVEKQSSSFACKQSGIMESEPIDTPPPSANTDVDSSYRLEDEFPEPESPPSEPLEPTSPPSWQSVWKPRCQLLQLSHLSPLLAPSRFTHISSSLTKPEKPLVFPPSDKIQLMEEPVMPSSDDDDDTEQSGQHASAALGYVKHHPRPLAVNGFGSWSCNGSGARIFNRREVLARWAVSALVEQTSHRSMNRRPDFKSGSHGVATVSSTVPYCDRYSSQLLFNQSSLNHDQVKTAMTSNQPADDTLKSNPFSLLNIRTVPQTQSMITSTTSTLSATTSSNQDSLWRSSFVCVSSPAVQSCSSDRSSVWASDSNGRFSIDSTLQNKSRMYDKFSATAMSAPGASKDRFLFVTAAEKPTYSLDQPPGSLLQNSTGDTDWWSKSTAAIKTASHDTKNSARNSSVTVNGQVQSSSVRDCRVSDRLPKDNIHLNSVSAEQSLGLDNRLSDRWPAAVTRHSSVEKPYEAGSKVVNTAKSSGKRPSVESRLVPTIRDQNSLTDRQHVNSSTDSYLSQTNAVLLGKTTEQKSSKDLSSETSMWAAAFEKKLVDTRSGDSTVTDSGSRHPAKTKLTDGKLSTQNSSDNKSIRNNISSVSRSSSASLSSVSNDLVKSAILSPISSAPSHHSLADNMTVSRINTTALTNGVVKSRGSEVTGHMRHHSAATDTISADRLASVTASSYKNNLDKAESFSTQKDDRLSMWNHRVPDSISSGSSAIKSSSQKPARKRQTATSSHFDFSP